MRNQTQSRHDFLRSYDLTNGKTHQKYFAAPVFRFVLLALSICASYHRVYTQSVLTNGNFETFQGQPPHYQQRDGSWDQSKFVSGWTTASEASPDLLTDFTNSSSNFACGSIGNSSDNPGSSFSNNQPYGCYPQVCPLENLWGEQNPHSGSNYLGFAMITNPNGSTHEYIQTSFPALTAGQCYRLSFWASRSDLSEEAVKLQAAISQGSIQNLSTTGLLDPYVVQNVTVLTSPTFIVDKVYWTQVTMDFVAIGGETHLTIGLFDPWGIEDPQNPSGPLLPTRFTEPYAIGTCGDANSSDPCTNCADELEAYYYIDDVSLSPTAGASFVPSSGCTFTTNNPNISGNFSNQNILISGDVVISANTTFSQCTVKCNDGSSITVPNGVTFTIDRSTLSAGCQNMWDGIILSGNIIVEGSTIKNAWCAINTQGSNATWAIRATTSGSPNLFKDNFVDMTINQYVSATNNVIKSTTFDHTSFGQTGIVFNGAGSSIALTVGGANGSDMCTFLGGINAIRAVYYPVTVDNCYFDNQAQAAIYFLGLANSSVNRKLTVLNSTFLNSKNHIWAANRTDLTVQKSTFTGALEHSIVWLNNRNGELLIGDETNAALGNTFSNNNWSAIYASGNKSSQTNSANLAAAGAGMYTEIVICRNTINCPSYASGIIISEPALSAVQPYKKLRVSSNYINTAHQGIQITNIRGWGGTTFTNEVSEIKTNYIGVSTQYFANSYGIKATNGGGLAITENQINSPNWSNYANTGIYCDNLDYSTVRLNIVLAGTGVLAAGWAYKSSVYCNLMGAYSTGFCLANSYLRSDPNDPHGEIGLKSYDNTVPYTTIPWNSDVFLWNSNVYNNKWMWNNGLTNLDITYAGNCGTGDVISTYSAPDDCPNIPFGITQYEGMSENLDLSIAGNSLLQWKSDYNHEQFRLMNGLGDSTVASNNIKRIIQAEDLINMGYYDSALAKLNLITNPNNIETNYKNVLIIFATINDEERMPDSLEFEALVSIAQMQTYEQGGAVFLSRAYLKGFYNLTFEDHRPMESHEVFGTGIVSAPCSLEPTSNTWLSFIDEDGNDLNIEGCYVGGDGSFIFDPNQINYSIGIYGTTPVRIFAKNGSQYTVVTNTFHSLEEWMLLSPVTIDLAGVSVDLDTVTHTEYVEIENYTSMVDGLSNEYSVGSVQGATGLDFLIEKRDRYNNLIWTRTWNGAVSGDDIATCMYLDAEGYIYVAGKTDNGKNFDVQILKYDSNGNLVWTSYFASADAVDNNPTGIVLNNEDGSVEITGIYNVDEFRYIKVWQCLPESRSHQNIVEEQPNVTTSASFYPNPTSSVINVDLKSHSGGLFQLYSLHGQLVFSTQVVKSGRIVLPEGLTDGVYLIKFIGEGEPIYQKLMIDKND